MKWKPQNRSRERSSENFDYDQLLSTLPEDIAAKLKLPFDIPNNADSTHQGMTEEKFWSLLETLDWTNQGDDAAVIEPTVRALSSCPTKEIYKFADMLSEKLFQLDGENLPGTLAKIHIATEKDIFRAVIF